MNIKQLIKKYERALNIAKREGFPISAIVVLEDIVTDLKNIKDD